MKFILRFYFLLLFLLIVNSFFSQQKVIDRVIAVVGKNIVLQSELEAQYSQYVSQQQEITENTRCELYEELLYQKLLLAQAQKDSIEVTEAQVDGELDRRLRYYIAQFGSQERFEEFYGKTVDQFKSDLRDNIKDVILSQRMQAKITEGVSVTPAEVKSYYDNLPEDSVPFINAEVEVGQIVKKAVVSTEAKQAAKETIEGIRKRVMQGEDMATLAVLYSEDPGSSKDGGVYKNIARGQFVPEFDAISFKMKEKQISEVFETAYGFHFMQLIERRGEVVDLRHILITPKTTYLDLQKSRILLDSIFNVLKNDSISFSDAAGKYSDDEETKGSGGLLVNPQTGISKFEMDELGQMEQTLVFTIDKMNTGDFIEPALFTTKDGKQAYRIIYLKSRTSPHKANLKDDYQRIQTAAMDQKQEKIIENWIRKKKANTYVKIADDFKNCKFNNNWNN